LLGMYLLGKLKFPHDDDDDGKTGVGRFFLAMISFAFAVYMLPGVGCTAEGSECFCSTNEDAGLQSCRGDGGEADVPRL